MYNFFFTSQNANYQFYHFNICINSKDNAIFEKIIKLIVIQHITLILFLTKNKYILL